MVKFFQHTFKYEYNWDSVTLAFWLRYPNPFASHVESVDVIDRYVDPDTGVLRTTRLILKRGVLPKWGNGLIKKPEAYIIEESLINPKTQTMITLTKNITHARMMQVEEWQTFRVDPNNREFTQVKTEARVISNFGWGLTERVEGFGIKKFADGAAKSRKGMSHVLEMIREKQLLRGRGFLTI
ncbi:PRELI-like family-domain-containing protein [Gigaspora rosea]|uniref:PRELI-like family-domain-containing protein n=1 Tax=Gigaspora rosea TaxID=44941 RepID=A0A397VEJ1_9GLOM|nr:PRELI-like family-domain-containing protein [Gigaspora rosea]